MPLLLVYGLVGDSVEADQGLAGAHGRLEGVHHADVGQADDADARDVVVALQALIPGLAVPPVILLRGQRLVGVFPEHFEHLTPV
ncbi:hypothetical protein H5P28_11880 [Ruficoccus amylovorans]|uniref:Uncharacterized protein n=1 Tax=Ruficoccus amylovorans TaxID=1804625 RepID=A0A842HHD4_9BACT|nr:hypothetical protein [Ruficoccus amylovorans]MBC2594957.1 hypothetical protein [Ruficoccus amylovorans]